MDFRIRLSDIITPFSAPLIGSTVVSFGVTFLLQHIFHQWWILSLLCASQIFIYYIIGLFIYDSYETKLANQFTKPSSNSASAALITGGTSGIGLEISKCFARDGYHLILISNDSDELINSSLSTLRNINKNIEITMLKRDLTQGQDALQILWSEVMETLSKKNFQLLFFCNNAGYGLACHSFDELSIQKQLHMLQLNIMATTQLSHLYITYVKQMKQQQQQQQHFCLMNTCSIASFVSQPLFLCYSASKAYLKSFSVGLRFELEHIHNAQSRNKIQVITLCPGMTKQTQFLQISGQKDSLLSKFFPSSLPKEVAVRAYRGMHLHQKIIIPGFFNNFMYVFNQFVLENWMFLSTLFLQRQIN